MLYQAGTSTRGKAFAARHAECVFISGPTETVVRKQAQGIRVDRIEANGAQLTARFAETGADVSARLNEGLLERVQEMDQRLNATSERILSSVNEGSHQAAARLNEAMLRIGDAVSVSVETITSRVGEADARIAATVGQGTEAFAERLESVIERIDGAINAADEKARYRGDAGGIPSRRTPSFQTPQICMGGLFINRRGEQQGDIDVDTVGNQGFDGGHTSGRVYRS